MSPVPFPADEAQRLAKLRSLEVLDTEPEVPFENATKLASFICGTPMAMVSLVDEERQWFKARVGLGASQTPRHISFCAHAVALNDILVVPDALLDPRFCESPLVHDEPFVRFYAGIPLRVDGGSPIGTLCVLDRVPRSLSAQQLEALAAVASQVETELGLRRRTMRPSSPPSWRAEAVLDVPPSGALVRAAVDISAPTMCSADAIDDAASPLSRGQLVAGRYLVDEVLGRGGMGVVLRATDTFHDRVVAMKFLHAGALPDQRLVERFVREAQILASLHSEHVARIYDVGNLPEGRPFIVMEYLRGIELELLLHQHGPLDVSVAHDLWLQAAEGVAVAHQAGIVHRDLKPSNMFVLDAGGRRLLKLLDFGVAKHHVLEGDPALTLAEDLVGTCHYMSPEQVLGSSTVAACSDVWSLGVVAYRMLTGALPFDGTGPIQVCARIMQNDAVAVDELRPEVPKALADVVMSCLAREPSHRFADATALLQALSSIEKPEPLAPRTEGAAAP